ncbi:MAG: TIGR00266 family protein [Deltaproteobacteria bacterium]|nr:TIGR00266 family protein [Deltaproteobacteria bacterium]
MQTEIRHRPAFANIRVQLERGDSLIAESDAMASMSSTVAMRARWAGGFFNALIRRVFGQESMFVNEFSTDSEGEVILTQPFPGDMECIELNGNTVFLQPGAFVACEPGVKLTAGWAGFGSYIGKEGLFRLKASGTGKLWFGAYGGIFTREITGELVVDTGHLVAYEPTLKIHMGMAGGIFSSFFGGEGLVSKIRGEGRVYLQSRSMGGLAAWTNAHLH